jgi:hypothetical protein
MGRMTTDTPVEIYAMTDGKKVQIENLSYTISREREPVFQLGSPMPAMYVQGQRTLTGSFDLTYANYKKLRLRHFDVYINVPDDNRTIYIKDVDMLSDTHLWKQENVSVTFIARDLDVDTLKRLEDMSNRELAKQLLEKEY